MTGIYVRIERDGRWQSVEFEDLTEAEMGAFIRERPASDGWAWAIRLAGWIREHGDRSKWTTPRGLPGTTTGKIGGDDEDERELLRDLLGDQ
jgi:hypothetical protein